MNNKLDILRDLAAKADERLGKKRVGTITSTQSALRDLIEFGRVEVGYRTSCGYTDPTTYGYREWVKLLARAAKLGVVIREEKLNHGNAYATTKGGFWNSSIYTIERGEVAND